MQFSHTMQFVFVVVFFFASAGVFFCYCDYVSAVATGINTSSMKNKKKTKKEHTNSSKKTKKHHDINNTMLYLMELLVRCSSVRLSYPRNRLPHRKSKAY